MAFDAIIDSVTRTCFGVALAWTQRQQPFLGYQNHHVLNLVIPSLPQPNIMQGLVLLIMCHALSSYRTRPAQNDLWNGLWREWRFACSSAEKQCNIMNNACFIAMSPIGHWCFTANVKFVCRALIPNALLGTLLKNGMEREFGPQNLFWAALWQTVWMSLHVHHWWSNWSSYG